MRLDFDHESQEFSDPGSTSPGFTRQDPSGPVSPVRTSQDQSGHVGHSLMVHILLGGAHVDVQAPAGGPRVGLGSILYLVLDLGYPSMVPLGYPSWTTWAMPPWVHPCHDHCTRTYADTRAGTMPLTKECYGLKSDTA